MTRRILSITNPKHRQVPFAEYDKDIQTWKIWQHYNKDSTAGSYLELYSTGAVELVTIGPDGLIADMKTVMKEIEQEYKWVKCGFKDGVYYPIKKGNIK